MMRRWLIAAGGAVVLLGAGSVVAYAWDHGRDDLIAGNVRIGGVDVGGLREAAAADELRRRLVPGLRRSVGVRVDGRTFRLTTSRARVRVDVDGMVAEALTRSRAGGLPGRLWRSVTGRRVSATLPARLSFSSSAVDRWVASVKRRVDRKPRDAMVEPSATSLGTVPSHSGVVLNAAAVKARVRAKLRLTEGPRTFKARARLTKPAVTTADLASKYPLYLTISRTEFKLRLWRNLKLAKTYPIAVGRIGFETPAGLYSIQDKTVDPPWTPPKWAGPELAGKTIPGGAPDNPLKARWLGFFDGAGIHGTDDVGSLGSAASHGCIRMSIPDVKELYAEVPVGTPTYIG